MNQIAVIGLGYVGLPLAIEFGKIYKTVGFDINDQRIIDLNQKIDTTLEIEEGQFLLAEKLTFTTDIENLAKCNIFIITVPTPIDENNKPDLGPLEKASIAVASQLKRDDIVIYESTVYPGVTEEICVPILEQHSGLVFNKDFFCGYSPERINPGDKSKTISSIKKITSGSNPMTAKNVDDLYKTIIKAGTYCTESIKVAEAAKVIENTQRDVNIALINELSKIFHKLKIDTEDVLKAAETKWNFLSFKPGLVGGHCIGVDPYYLTHKAEEVGYSPEIILAGRRLNDNMGRYIAEEIIQIMQEKHITIKGSRALILGLTFKENCPDTRNSKVYDLIEELRSFDLVVDACDPWVEKDVKQENLDLINIQDIKENYYDAIVLAVAHNQFKELGPNRLRSFGKSTNVIYDIKYILKAEESDGRL